MYFFLVAISIRPVSNTLLEFASQSVKEANIKILFRCNSISRPDLWKVLESVCQKLINFEDFKVFKVEGCKELEAKGRPKEDQRKTKGRPTEDQ